MPAGDGLSVEPEAGDRDFDGTLLVAAFLQIREKAARGEEPKVTPEEIADRIEGLSPAQRRVADVVANKLRLGQEVTTEDWAALL